MQAARPGKSSAQPRHCAGPIDGLEKKLIGGLLLLKQPINSTMGLMAFAHGFSRFVLLGKSSPPGTIERFREDCFLLLLYVSCASSLPI